MSEPEILTRYLSHISDSVIHHNVRNNSENAQETEQKRRKRRTLSIWNGVGIGEMRKLSRGVKRGIVSNAVKFCNSQWVTRSSNTHLITALGRLRQEICTENSLGYL